MIVHDAVTGVVETPAHLLREHLVTPKELLFVRNNQVLPGSLTLSPFPATDWELELNGLITPAQTFNFSDLAGIEQSEVVAVLQCAGNGRAFYSQTAMAKGTQWQRGGMGQIRWKGVRLKQLLDSSGLMVDEDARFLTAEGRDSPASSDDDDYEQSVPLVDVLETAPARDAHERRADTGHSRRTATAGAARLLRVDEREVGKPTAVRERGVEEPTPCTEVPNVPRAHRTGQ